MIVVYTARGCVFCSLLKDLFRRNGIRFQERRIDTNPQWLSEWEQLGHIHRGAVPVTRLEDGEIFVGFPRDDSIIERWRAEGKI